MTTNDDLVDPVLAAQWQQIAIEIGAMVYSAVNTRDEQHTGYVLMFFSAEDDDGGKSTLVSSTTDVIRLKRLLRYALKNLNKAKHVELGREQ